MSNPLIPSSASAPQAQRWAKLANIAVTPLAFAFVGIVVSRVIGVLA